MMHLSPREVRAFVAGELDPAAWRRVVRHLLTGCGSCREKLAATPLVSLEEPALPAEAHGADYEGAFHRALAAARRFGERWEQERGLAGAVLPFITRNPDQGLQAIPRGLRDAAFGWPLVEAFLQASWEERFRNPRRMALLASQACKVADATPEEGYPEGFTADLRARARAELANAYRVQEQYGRAEEALAHARQDHKRGTGDPVILGAMLEIEAALRRAQRRIPEALTILTTACDVYRELWDDHLLGRAMVSKGLAFSTNREPAKAMRCLHEGLSLIDRTQLSPQFVSTTYQALIGALVECHEYHRAGKLLLMSGLRQAFAAEPLNLLQVRWVEGKIHAGLGRLDKAERAFQEVRAGLREHALEYEAALAGLDLAAVWLRQGDVGEIRQLAQETLATFRRVGIQAEAFKAMRLLETVCDKNAVSLRTVEGIRAFLDRLQAEPHLTVREALNL